VKTELTAVGFGVITVMTMKSTIFCDLKFTEVSKELTAFIFRVAK
jgi:hypothetical protein